MDDDVIQNFHVGCFTASNGLPIRYQLYRPTINHGERLPILLHLHGAGSWENDNTTQLAQASRWVKNDYRCFILAPKTLKPMKWVDLDWSKTGHKQPETPTPSLVAAHELLHSFLQENSIVVDSHRVYLNGQSMGGYGAWDMATRWPGDFAAVVPVCGGGDTSRMARLVNLPLWVFHGLLDREVPVENSRLLVAALHTAGARSVHYTEYPDVAHNAWRRAYNTDDLFQWLFQQHQ